MKWEDQPPVKQKHFFRERLCIAQNYVRVKIIIAALLLLFICKATRVLLGTNLLTSSLKRYWNVYWSGGTDIFPVCYSL